MTDASAPQVLPARMKLEHGVVLALLVQTISLFVWGAKLEQRVVTLEQKVEAAEQLAVTVARVDERTASLVTTVNRIETGLSHAGRRP